LSGGLSFLFSELSADELLDAEDDVSAVLEELLHAAIETASIIATVIESIFFISHSSLVCLL
jgi:hypothetical protein